MTGHVIVRFEGAVVARSDWEAFCGEHAVVYMPEVVGRNIYCLGGRHGVECVFGAGVRGAGAESAGPPDSADQVVFTTSWGGSKQDDLARIARAFWVRFGGSMFADEDSRRRICGVAPEPA